MKLRYGFIVVCLGLVFVFAGHMDAQDAAREHVAYCNNVKDGVLPDYNGTYKSECTSEKLQEISKILR